MNSYWATKKTVQHMNLRVEFQWLMEDMRDMMSDCIKPQMGRNTNRNRIDCVDIDRNISLTTVEVPVDLGNYYYKCMKQNPSAIEYLMDQCYLDVCAYHNDFDCYSDTYKDINGIRPHYTQEQWDLVVQNARNLK